jgi:hypothetical protein
MEDDLHVEQCLRAIWGFVHPIFFFFFLLGLAI